MSGSAPKPAAPALPTVGRIVLHRRDGVTRPAIVNEIGTKPDVAGLTVFRAFTEVDERGEGPVFAARANYSEDPTAEGCWSWPPRAE